MDEAAWGALAITLTLLGGLYTYVAYQRRGLPAAVRGGAITLLPVAAWLTGVLELLTEMGGAVGSWAADLAFSPTMWLGAGLAGLAAVLFVVSGFLANREIGERPKESRRAPKELRAPRTPAQAPVVDSGAGSDVDAEMAEIEAILRKRGIT
ncbi:hypothetical protein [Nocardioides dilutus]